MLLRRIIEHVKTQNWTAVALDFVIVVVGVFIGIQVANWNDARAEEKAYQSARLRLIDEIDTNLDKISVTQAELADALPRVSRGIDALRDCQTGPEAEKLVVDAIREAQLTRGHKFTRSALTELTQDAALLGRQSESDRRAFQGLRDSIDHFQFEADFLEMKPLDEPIWRQPALKMSAAEVVNATYRGDVWRYLERDLTLSVPLDEACKDVALIASLYEYERLQSGLSAVFTIAMAELKTIKEMIAGNGSETD